MRVALVFLSALVLVTATPSTAQDWNAGSKVRIGTEGAYKPSSPIGDPDGQSYIRRLGEIGGHPATRGSVRDRRELEKLLKDEIDNASKPGGGGQGGSETGPVFESQGPGSIDEGLQSPRDPETSLDTGRDGGAADQGQIC